MAFFTEFDTSGATYSRGTSDTPIVLSLFSSTLTAVRRVGRLITDTEPKSN